MKPILPPMNEAQQAMYDRFKAEHPWMNNVKMSDDELRRHLDNIHGTGFTDTSYAKIHLSEAWCWICIDAMKYFFATGKRPRLCDYLDGQLDYELYDWGETFENPE